MEWTCTECGSAAKADAAELLVHAGWWVTELRRGLCPACTRVAAHAFSLPDGPFRTGLVMGERARGHHGAGTGAITVVM
jgi:hypothetical protein